MSDQPKTSLRDAIAGRAARNPKPPPKGKRKRRQLTQAELDALPPSHRERALRGRSVPVYSGSGLVMMGRPSKLTRELIGDFVTNLLSGAPVERIAGALGVHTSTLHEWLAKGHAHASETPPRDSLYRDLADAAARAREQWWVKTYAKISSGTAGWQGRAWLAERLDRATLGRQQSIEVTGKAGGAIRITGSVELPAEIPDGHPSLSASSNGVSRLNGAGHREASLPILSSGVRLPDEEDPD